MTKDEESAKIRSRIMYGSDYFLNIRQVTEFENYYGNFKAVFNKDQLENMMLVVPKSFLGV